MESDLQTWQLLFNLAFTAFLSLLGLWFRNINSELKTVKTELSTLHTRMNESAADLRRDHTECQRALPDLYVPRRELENLFGMFREDLTEIKTILQKLQESRSSK